MRLGDFAARLDERLGTDAYADIDASANGLQVGPDGTDVEHAAFAVDAAAATIEEAAAAGADVLVTHHGLVWGGLDRITGRKYDRLAPLFDDDVALYVSHLPLDGHRTLGNAAGVGDLLDLVDREPFGAAGPEHVGLRGRASDPYSVRDLAALLDRELDHGRSASESNGTPPQVERSGGGRGVQLLDFGPDRVEDVAVVTGSGVDWLDEAAEAGADALVTGEGKQKAYHEAREAGVNVLLAGHYATETFGVRSLLSLAEEWGLETTYVDHPTGL